MNPPLSQMQRRLYQSFARRALPLTIGAALLFYVAFTATALIRYDGNPYWFVWIGERFRDLEPAGRLGYDGQFAYYIARDGLEAEPNLDVPAYRLQRIALPAVAWALSFGNEELIAWNLLFINFVAIVVTTALLARWLRSRNLSPWYALAYSLYLGTFMAFSRDVTEPLAYGLAAAGMIAWLDGRRPWALVWLALAGLTKESALLFPIGIGLAAVARRDVRTGTQIALSSLPLLAWELFLSYRFGVLPVGLGSSLRPIPFQGLFTVLSPDPGHLSGLLFVAVPGVVLLVISAALLRRRWREPIVWLLTLHAIFVLLLPADVYSHVMHAARNASGLVLAALFAYPLLDTRLRAGLTLYWIAPTWVWLVPVLRWAPWLSEV